MAMQQEEHWFSLEEYHEIERNSEVKYEYCDGHIYAMSGGTAEHSRIAINLTLALELHLREKDCRVFNSDMKVLPRGDENPSYLPDITVTCNPDDYKRGSTAIRSPRLIVEVLSPSSYERDRIEKLDAYRDCESCEEYMMVSSHHQQVEVYHRKGPKEWRITNHTTEDNVQLTSIGLVIPVAEIYAQTEILPMDPLKAVFYLY